MDQPTLPKKDRGRNAHTHPLVQKGIMNGRHPRSLVPGGELWHLLDESNERVYHCTNGRRLHTVNEEMRRHGHFGLFSDTLDNHEERERLRKPSGRRLGASASTTITATSLSRSASLATSASTSSLGKKSLNKVPFAMQLDGLAQTLNRKQRQRGSLAGGPSSSNLGATAGGVTGGSSSSSSSSSSTTKGRRAGAQKAGSSSGGGSGGGGSSSSSSSSSSSRDVYKAPPTPLEQLTYLSKLTDTRLHFGATVALQSSTHQDAFFVVHESQDAYNTGKAFTTNPQQCSTQHDTILFKVVDLNDLNSFRPVHYDDKIYLQVIQTSESVRADELKHWKDGSVLGAHVTSTKELPTMPLDRNATWNSHGGLSPEKPEDRARAMKEKETLRKAKGFVSHGNPHPVRAYTPNVEDFPSDRREQVCHESRQGNSDEGNGAIMLGYWRVRPATKALREEARARTGGDPKKEQGPVFNTDKVYLEQDFFYMVSDDRPESLAAAQSPHASLVATVAQKKFYKGSRPIELQALPEELTGADDKSAAAMALAALKIHEPLVERRGVFTLFIATHSAIDSKARGNNRQAEQRMDMALKVIEQSQLLRNGGRKYLRQKGGRRARDRGFQTVDDPRGNKGKSNSALGRAKARRNLADPGSASRPSSKESGSDSVNVPGSAADAAALAGDAAEAGKGAEESMDVETLYGGEEFSVDIRSNAVAMLRTKEREAVKKHRLKASASHRFFADKFHGPLGPDPAALTEMEMLDDQPEALEDFDVDGYTVEEGTVTAQYLKGIADTSIGSVDSHTSLWSYVPKPKRMHSVGHHGSFAGDSTTTSGGGGMKALRVQYKSASKNIMLAMPGGGGGGGGDDSSAGYRQRLNSSDGGDTVISGITQDDYGGTTFMTASNNNNNNNNNNPNDDGSSLDSVDENYTIAEEPDDYDGSGGGSGGDGDGAAEEIDEEDDEEDEEEETEAERKTRLLNASASWPFNLAAEDDVVKQELEEEEELRRKVIEDAKWDVSSTPKHENASGESPKSVGGRRRGSSFFGGSNGGSISPQSSLRRQSTFRDSPNGGSRSPKQVLSMLIRHGSFNRSNRSANSRSAETCLSEDDDANATTSRHQESSEMAAMRAELEDSDGPDFEAPLNDWMKKWSKYIKVEKVDDIEDRLLLTDTLIAQNNAFDAKRKQLKEMMGLVGMGSGSATEKQLEFKLKVFNRDETLMNFNGNDRLMREMLQSTTQIFEGRLMGEVNVASSSGDVTKLQKVLDVIEHLTKVVDSEHLREKCARVKQTLKNINRDGGTDFFIPEDHRRDFRVHCDALEGAMQDFVQAKTWRRKEQLKPPPPPPEG